MTVETMSSKPPIDQQSASDTAGNKPKDPELDLEISRLSTEDIASRTRLLEHEIRIMRSDIQRLNHELSNYAERIKENKERIKVNKHLPYLVANVIELLDLDGFASDEQEGANVDLDASKTKCAVIKTSTRATYFLPVIGLVEAGDLNPGDLVGVNKDSYLILEKLPIEYDSRVKAMEIDERPTEQYSDIGGLDTQIQELIEAVVLPMTHKERFVKLGIQPSKGVLLYGPPGTGKTMMARAVAAQTKSTFLKLAGPQLVQMFIGDGAKLVRDAFALAKEKAPAIIFIDELDAIGMNRSVCRPSNGGRTFWCTSGWGTGFEIDHCSATARMRLWVVEQNSFLIIRHRASRRSSRHYFLFGSDISSAPPTDGQARFNAYAKF